MRNILIVDDDVHIGNMLEKILTNEGYSVSRALSGRDAITAMDGHAPDLVLLDLMMPGLCGEDVLPHIKDIPVIVVSAKTATEGKVNLLLGGATDYVTKPFDIGELLARIKVALRNQEKQAQNSVRVLEFDGIELDTESHTVKVSGKPVKLTRTEFAILRLLMQNPSSLVAKSVILDRISRDTPDCVESSLKVHISNLRKKLKEINGRDYIEAVWGIGFKMRES